MAPINKKITVFSWALYDFANTIFSMNIVSLYFALWVTVTKGAQDITYSIALSLSMLIAAFLEPLLGTISDIRQNKMRLLMGFTAACCVFTVFMGFSGGLYTGLIFFIAANAAYQIASIFYNAMLSHIAEKSDVGRVSGMGVSLGYVGTLVGLFTIKPFVLKSGYQAAFIPTALLFFAFSLPCFIFVKETKLAKGTFELPSVKNAFLRIKRTFTENTELQGVKYFLIAAFLFMNAVNTVIIFMSVYIKKVVGFSDSEIVTFYVISTSFTIISSFLYGFVTDRVGPYKALGWVLKTWCVGMALVMLNFSKTLFWFIGPIAGAALGATWVSSRALAIHLAPKEKMGEIFGMFGLTGKASSIIGPLLWGLAILVFTPLGLWRYRIAILTQLLLVILSMRFFKKINGI
ncbi:MAG: MFS transporter [Candidatus Omnitrophica bacterium]|nr:MFS transporter [Candidatus Omnitrophota bacterium]